MLNMPLSIIPSPFQKGNSDIEKTALYPRQGKNEPSVENSKKKKKATPGLIDLLRADGSGGDSKMITSSAFANAWSAPDKPEANAADMLSYWRTVAQASRAEKESVSLRLTSVLKKVRMDGFKQASTAKTWPAKIFWLFMLCVIVGVLSYEIWKCVHDYHNSPIATKFTISTPRSMNFPNVYVCFGSAMNRTFMSEHKDLMAVAIGYRNRNAVTKGKHNRKKRDSGFDEISTILQMSNDKYGDEIEPEFADESIGFRQRRDAATDSNRTNFADIAALKAAQARIDAMFDSPNISDVIYEYYENAGFKVDETFLECSFQGYTNEKLNCKDIIKPVLDLNYYLCYVVDLPDGIQQTIAGKGLNLVINSQVSLYPKALAEKPPLYKGIFVSVDKDFSPFNWEKTCVAPGRLTKLDLAMTHVHLLDFDSGSLIQHCLSDADAANELKILNATYSRITCQMDCLFQSHKNNCDCVMLVDKSLLKNESLDGAGFCSPQQFAQCIGRLPNNDTAQKEVNECVSNCYSPCESYRFDMRASSAKIHESSYCRFKLPENVNANDLVDLRVAFSRLEYAELIQSPSASLSDMIANLGGQINLWMGASMVSILEMGFMAIGFALWSCYMKIGRRLNWRQEINDSSK